MAGKAYSFPGPLADPEVYKAVREISSVSLVHKEFASSFYSGFGYDDNGHRSQIGIPTEWEAVGRHHNVYLQHDHDEGIFGCYANNVLVHCIRGRVGHFKIELKVEAVGISGNFDFRIERLMYRPAHHRDSPNLEALRCWRPEYSPTFVSYSHADKGDVQKLTRWLRTKGVRVMGDWDFNIGDSLIERISSGISRSSFLVVVLTPASVASRWVSKELEIAISRQLSKESPLRIVPILLADCEIPVFLKGTLRFDLTDRSTDQPEKLLECLSFKARW